MQRARYNSVAIALHWAIALLIVGQIAGGLYMHELPNSSALKFPLYQLHKSFGLSILVLTFFRLGWRLTHKVPALPAALPGWQKFIARATHWAFYALLVLTPLAGWAMVSVSPKEIPTVWFGLFEVPHLPFFDGVAERGAAEGVIAERHEFLAFTILFLLALHAAAALKHGIFDRDGVLKSMAPARLGAWIVLGIVLGGLFAGAAYSLGAGFAPAPESEPGIAQAPSARAPADWANWIVDYEASHLRVVGEEKEKTFTADFSDFAVDIYFDPNALEQSRIEVVVRTGAGGVGDPLRDSEWGKEAWFDVENHPTAVFASRAVRHLGGNAYAADGQLTIKEFTKDIALPFTLDITGARATARGSADLVRTDFGLGMDASWLEEEDVSLAVRVEFEITASRAE